MSPNTLHYRMAIQDFQAARQRAAVEEILARLKGKSNQLLSYDDVAEKLKLRLRTERGIQQIPLDAIVGSVGRNTDFTRTFLPRQMKDQQRWARVKAAVEDGLDLPPIEVYKVGEVYFVVDGNHRVSIAKQAGAPSIAARVIEFKTTVPLTPEVQPDDLIIQAEYAEFLEATRIHEARPNVDLRVTSCCQYDTLMDEIRVSQYVLEEQGRQQIPPVASVSLQEAAAFWYDTTYIPLAEAIRDRGLLHSFPKRTITDLYIWIEENRAALEEELGWAIRSEAAAADLIMERSYIRAPGSWRRARTVSRYIDHLFADILVPLSGDAGSWDALEQAFVIARREGATLHGLHIVDSTEQAESASTAAVRASFDQRCAEAGLEGTLIVEVGDVARKISERAAMTDLMVVKIAHPPKGRLARFSSPWPRIVADSACPVLTVPGKATALQRALLFYDPGRLGNEALFVAAYLAEIWKTKLFVMLSQDGSRQALEEQEYVRRYLELHEVDAIHLSSERGSTDFWSRSVPANDIDLVLLANHGDDRLEWLISGSELGRVLVSSTVPVFLCH